MASYLDAQQSFENFLEDNYMTLQSVNVTNFYPWLRTKGIINGEDQADIEHMHTPRRKAGRLIEVIEMRGDDGFCAYMDVLEACHPATYRQVTGREADPNKPNVKEIRSQSGRESSGNRRPISEEVQEKLVDLLTLTTNDMVQKKREINTLRQLKDKLQEEGKIWIQKFEQLENENRELQERLYDCDEALAQMRSERDELQSRYTGLMESRDVYRDQLNSTKKECGSASAWRTRSLKCMAKLNEMHKIMAEKDNLQKQLDVFRANSVDIPCGTASWPREELCALREKVSKLEKEKDLFESQLGAAECDCNGYVEQLEQYANQILEIKTERDQFKHLCEDREEKIKMIEKDNNRLQNLTKKLNDKLTNMADFRPRLPPLVIPHAYSPGILSSEDNVFAGFGSVGDDAKQTLEPKTPPRRAGFRRNTSEEVLGRRRKPAVLMADVSIRQPLMDALMASGAFIPCPDTVLHMQPGGQWVDHMTEEGCTFHYRKDGDRYICLEKATLETAMRAATTRVLLCVPAEAIPRLHKMGIDTINVIVKICQTFDSSTKSLEEEEFEKIRDRCRASYELVRVTPEEARNIDSLMKKVKQVVDKHDKHDDRSSHE